MLKYNSSTKGGTISKSRPCRRSDNFVVKASAVMAPLPCEGGEGAYRGGVGLRDDKKGDFTTLDPISCKVRKGSRYRPLSLSTKNREFVPDHLDNRAWAEGLPGNRGERAGPVGAPLIVKRTMGYRRSVGSYRLQGASGGRGSQGVGK